MTTAFTAHGWKDYLFWQQNDPGAIKKINELILDIHRNPFTGIAKPESLRGKLTGYWSRRITDEHRLVYRIHGSRPNQVLTIIQFRFHY